MTHVPALGKPTGPDERRARFFSEIGAGMEMLALYYSLSADKQLELQQYMLSLAADVELGKKRRP